MDISNSAGGCRSNKSYYCSASVLSPSFNHASVLLKMLTSFYIHLYLFLLLHQWHQPSPDTSQACKHTFSGKETDGFFTESQERPDCRHCEGKRKMRIYVVS